jgi:hypothetical protein
MGIVNNWYSGQIDFVQAYTQTNVEKYMYMDVPKGFEVSEPRDYVSKITRIYSKQLKVSLPTF